MSVGSRLSTLSAPRRTMSVSRPGSRSGSSRSQSATELAGGGPRPELAGQRVLDSREELDVRVVRVARALADPQQMGRAVVPVAGEAVAPREALLVRQDQALVAGPEIDLVQLMLALQVDAAGRHEAQGVVDAARDPLVAAPSGERATNSWFQRWTCVRSAKPPLVKARSRLRRRRRLVVGLQQPRGIGRSRAGLGGVVVDHVAAERRQLDDRRRARWGSSAAWRTAPPRGRASRPAAPAAYVSTVAICSMILRLSRMRGAESSRNDSAQSPTWRRNASPAATSARARRS